jgi:hypothetical protein
MPAAGKRKRLNTNTTEKNILHTCGKLKDERRESVKQVFS